MKKEHIICFVLSVCFVAVGIVFRAVLNVLDIILVLLGVSLFLITFWRVCVSKAPRCPNCSAIIHSGHIRTIARQKDGIIQCEKCGSLVRVKALDQKKS